MNECWVKDCPRNATEVLTVDTQDFKVCREHYIKLNAVRSQLKVQKQ